MNVGNIDIEPGDHSVTLRMRHLVHGHPGAVLSFGEVRQLIARLERCISGPALPREAPPPAPKKAPDDEDLIG